MAEKRGQYQYNDDGSISSLVAGDIAIEESKAIVPVDIQARLSQTIQTHNAVSVATITTSSSSWIDCDGFDKVAINFKNDAVTSANITLTWSNDGSTSAGEETNVSTGTTSIRSFVVDVKARYLTVKLYNADTVSHIMSASIYLKA